MSLYIPYLFFIYTFLNIHMLSTHIDYDAVLYYHMLFQKWIERFSTWGIGRILKTMKSNSKQYIVYLCYLKRIEKIHISSLHKIFNWSKSSCFLVNLFNRCLAKRRVKLYFTKSESAGDLHCKKFHIYADDFMQNFYLLTETFYFEWKMQIFSE